MIAAAKLNLKVRALLDKIGTKRVASLEQLTLTALLNKNPYLYQSQGHLRPEDFLDALLAARISSSDETIFGNDFFEPLALWAAQTAKIKNRVASVSDAAGADISITTPTEYFAISVKSGKNIFNSQSSQGQSSEFSKVQARMKKLGKAFLPLIGYGYGRNSPREAKAVDKKAGQAFWALLSGEEAFYLRVSDAIGTCAGGHKADFEAAFELKRAALVKQFIIHFTTEPGLIDWHKVVAFNSASTKPKPLPITKES